MGLASCGKMENLPGQESEKILYTNPAMSESYTYEFTNRKCSTGIQSFETFFAICDGLKDEKLNDSCAIDDRKTLYEASDCPGYFEEDHLSS